MFTDPLTLKVGPTIAATTGGTSVSLPKINQDSYGSEYFAVAADGLSEYRVKIRHSNENVKTGANKMQRHQLSVVQYVYPTTTVPLGRTREAYTILRVEVGDTISSFTDLVKGLVDQLTAGNITKLVGWES